MDTSNVIKVVAAFVGGLVVALGSALIYVRVADLRHPPVAPVTAAASPGARELPEAGNDTPPQETPPPAPATDTQPAPPERPKFQPLPKVSVQPHRPVLRIASSNPVQKPVVIAQNRPEPAPAPAPAPVVNEPAPVQSAPESVQPAAQDQPNYGAAPMPAPAEPHVVTLRAGTVLSIRLGETLSTDQNYTGDTFRGTLLSPVIQDGFIIADRGSKVLGRVVNSQSAGHLANVAAITLAVTEINTTDGQRVRVETSVFNRLGGSNVGQDAAKIAGGAALGAIIGGIAGGGKGAAIGAGAGGAAGTGAVLLTHGRPAVVENETALTFRLANPVTITERLN